MADLKPTDWLKKSLEGDPHSYELFLNWAAQFIRNIAKKRLAAWGLNSSELLEDFTQEVLLAIHQKRHTYLDTLPVEPWMSGIIRYKSIDWLRKNINENKYISFQDSFEQVGPEQEGHENSSMDIETVLGTLTARQREALELSKIQGLSIEEISKQTGVSISAVKVNIHRAMKSLQKRFGKGQE